MGKGTQVVEKIRGPCQVTDRAKEWTAPGEFDCAKVVGGARQGWTVHGDRASVDRATRLSRASEMDELRGFLHSYAFIVIKVYAWAFEARGRGVGVHEDGQAFESAEWGCWREAAGRRTALEALEHLYCFT